MKVFFFYIGTPTPILETDFELIRKHDQAGDDVRVLQCTGKLPNCNWNPNHFSTQCASCRSKFKRGIKILNPSDKVRIDYFDPDRSLLPRSYPPFESVEDLMGFRHDGENIGYGVASSLISQFRDHRINTVKYRSEIIRGLDTSILIYESLKEEFACHRPDLVYIFNGRLATHLPAVLLCKRLGIDFYTYETAGKTNCYRLEHEKTVHTVVSTTEIEELDSNWTAEHEAFGSMIYQKRRTGTQHEKMLHFTALQKTSQLPESFDPTSRNIAIFNSTIDEYAGIEHWKNILYDPDETAGIKEILEDFERMPEFVFYLRIHPNMKSLSRTTSQLADIEALAARFDNLCVIWPSDAIDSYALMEACEKTLTFGSTMGVEATYWGKPSLLGGQAAYENFNCAYRPRTHAELVELLKADLKAMPRIQAIKYAYREFSIGVPYEFFKETGMRNGLAYGLFDGKVIEASLFHRTCFKIQIIVLRLIKSTLQSLGIDSRRLRENTIQRWRRFNIYGRNQRNI